MELNVISYSKITNNKVIYKGNEVSIQRTESSWFHDIYRSLKLSYPKFFKMDHLSKAGFLASEFLLQEEITDRETPKKDIAILLMNRSASLDDDRMYQKTIQDKENYFPSPAVFVYTLPNIVTGEIAIRNKIMGETSFFVSETFSPKQLYQLSVTAFTDPDIKRVICGWTDYELNNCDVFLLLLSNENKEGIPFTINNINNLYK